MNLILEGKKFEFQNLKKGKPFLNTLSNFFFPENQIHQI